MLTTTAVPAESHRAREERVVAKASVFAAAVLAAGYLLLFWSLDASPLQDLPNHLARAVVEADLLLRGGERFGSLFTVQLRFWPYVGGDVALIALVAAFGPDVAGRLWMIAVAASLPIALGVYLGAAGHSRQTILLSTVLSLYLTTDWFFLSGVHHYRLGIAFVLVALATLQAWLRHGTWGSFAMWAVSLTLAYLMHLAGLLFALAGAGIVGTVLLVARKTTWRRAFAGTLPAAVLIAWQVHDAGGAPSGELAWGGIMKIPKLFSNFYRYEGLADAALLVAFAGACGLLLAHHRPWRELRADERFIAAVSLALLFLGMYAVMPFSSGGLFYIDTRALPLVVTFALVACLAAAEGAKPPPRSAVALALLVAAGNLAVISAPLLKHNAALRAYRAIAAQAPPGARVLPVATAPRDGHVDPYLHAGAFATLDRGVMTPYLFTGGPTRYFQYKVPPRMGAAHEFWYQRGETLAPEVWSDIVEHFDYLLVKKPYDPARLPVATLEVARDDVAALLKIVR